MARSPFKRRKKDLPVLDPEGKLPRRIRKQGGVFKTPEGGTVVQSGRNLQISSFDAQGNLTSRVGGESIRAAERRAERTKEAFNNLGAAFVAGLESSAGRFNQRVPKADLASQILAGITLPFFVVVAMKAAEALMEIVRQSVPDTFILAGAAAFLVGFALLVAVAAFSFAWVKSGGFRLFHDLF